jgi:predicted phosphodiesterase
MSRMEEAYGIWMINPGAVCVATRNSPAYAEILIGEDGSITPNLVRWSGEGF